MKINNSHVRLHLLAVILLAFTPAAFPCVNPIGSPTVGGPFFFDHLRPDELVEVLTTHQGKAHWLQVLGQLKLGKGEPSDPFDRKINTAVAMLHLGMIRQAIAILENIETTKPGSYYTAANLGTAYELNGENAKALKWIKEGITRNADAHNGSEWLHVKILEAKLALEKDPNWLTTNSVIGIHRLSEEQLRSDDPVTTGNRGVPIDLKNVEAAIAYQLHERLEFIKPPDGVVAHLLFDLSRILAHTRDPRYGEPIRAFALTYGPDLMPWSVPDPVLPVIKPPPPPPPTSMTMYSIIGGSALIAVLAVALYTLRRSRRSGGSSAPRL